MIDEESKSAAELIVEGEALSGKARARLSEISFASTLEACLHRLRHNPNDGVDWYSRRPYLTLLMLKWATEMWRPVDERRPGNDSDFDFVIEQIFQSEGRLLQGQRWSIMRRRIAFQQFWYQRSFDVGSITRQALIFGRLMHEADVVRGDAHVARAFEEDIGVTTAGFVRQLARMVAQSGRIVGHDHLEFIAPSAHESDITDWPRMSKFLIASPAELHDRSTRLAAYNTPRAVELCEQTPLIRTPFITTHRGDECVHHQVLFQALATALYDALRDRGAAQFMRVFGRAFERYIGLVLAELPYPVIPEAQLKSRLVGPGKCVDFAVVSDDAILLIDAKGIEGHYDERYHNLSEVLTEKLRTTAIHATQQGVESAARLPANLRRPLTFFVCVTYKQLNIGDGGSLRDLTLGTDEWNHPRWQSPELLPDHMFTISIAEFELLCGVLRNGVPLSQVLGGIIEANRSPETRRFLFDQYLSSYGEVDVPECARLAAYELCGIE